MKLDLLTDKDLAPEREAVREPVKVWQNWWRAKMRVSCPYCGSWTLAGGQYVECCVGPWPSKDTAETAAERAQALEISQWGDNANEYLGAYPEGERPK